VKWLFDPEEFGWWRGDLACTREDSPPVSPDSPPVSPSRYFLFGTRLDYLSEWKLTAKRLSEKLGEKRLSEDNFSLLVRA
jgi:hypothetical protein